MTINELRQQIERLQSELERLEAEERQEARKRNYINTMEYHFLLVLRTAGAKNISYKDALQFMEDAEQRSIDFDTKHPYSFLDEDIIEEYKLYGL